MLEIVNFLNKYVWSNALVFLFLAVGLIFTLRTRFVQVRRFKDMITLLFEKIMTVQGFLLSRHWRCP